MTPRYIVYNNQEIRQLVTSSYTIPYIHISLNYIITILQIKPSYREIPFQNFMLCRQNSLNIAYTQLADRLYTCWRGKKRRGQPADRPTNAYGDAFLAANSAAILQILLTMHRSPLISVAGEEILEVDGEEVMAASASARAAAALLVAVAVHLAEAAEVAAADPRDDVAAEVVPGGGVVAARLHGEVVQGALPVHDEPVLLRAAVPHRPEHLVERPVVRARHWHQPGQGRR